MTFLLHGFEGIARMSFDDSENFLRLYGMSTIVVTMTEDGSIYREMEDGRERLIGDIIVACIFRPRAVALEAMREGFNLVPLAPVMSLTINQVMNIFTCPDVVTLKVHILALFPTPLFTHP